MVKKVKWGKKFIATLLLVSVVGTPITYKVVRNNEVNRVKGYLEDFLTLDNYVDLSKIDSNYDIRDFKGDILREALVSMDIDYVRITDSFIYDKNHVTGFVIKNAVNKDIELGYDDNGDMIYGMYEPIREASSSGVNYIVPEGYELEDVLVYAEPIRYDELNGRNIIVDKNNYEDSYSLRLTNGKNK